MDKLVSAARELGLDLSRQQVARFQRYYEVLVDWNRRINLTTIVDYEDVQVKHFLDSLTGVLGMEEGMQRSLASAQMSIDMVDVGSGGGLPGVPLAIVYPRCRVVLVESVGKKALFLQHLIGELELERVEVAAQRAEVLGQDARYRERFDVALSRGVAKLPALAELLLPLCRIGGRAIAYRKGNVEVDMAQARAAIDRLGGRPGPYVTIDMAGLRDGRCLVVVDKVAPTPDRYPRRPGMPSKRPILQ